MAFLRIAVLPDEPLAAAAAFYAHWLPGIVDRIRSLSGEEFTIVFRPTDHTHRGWRLSATRELARAHAPLRVNAIASDDEDAIAAATRYLAGAPAVTGQYLPLAGTGGAQVLS